VSHLSERSGAGGHPGDLLSAWLDDELPAAEAALVATHVEGCSACAYERDQVDAARTAVRRLSSLDAPAGVLRPSPAVHVGDFISACLDGELDEDLRPGIDAHLDACPACAAERDEVAWARNAVRHLPPVEPPAEALRPAWAWPAPTVRPPGHVRPRTRQLLAATAAVAAVGAGVLGLVGREGPADPSRPAVASFVSQHSTSSPGPDAVSGLAPAAMPISFSR